MPSLTFVRRVVILPLLQLLAIVCAQSFPRHYHSIRTHLAGQCHDVPGVPRLHLDLCSDDEMILVVDVIQGRRVGGRGAHGRCQYSPGDCVDRATGELDARLGETCVGRPRCSVAVDVGWMRRCHAFAEYNHISYQCIPRVETADICVAGRRLVRRIAYISSPRYPSFYPSDTECACSVVTDRNQRLLVRVAGDSSLEWSPGCRADALVVQDVGDGDEGHDVDRVVLARCGHLPTSLNVTTHTHAVIVAFRADPTRQYRGFWLAVEALGRMSLSCGPARMLLRSTDRPSSSSDVMMTASQPGSIITTLATADNFDESRSDSSDYDGYRHTGIYREGASTQDVEESLKIDSADPTDKSKFEQIHSLIIIILIAFFVSVIVISAAVFVVIVWLKKRRHNANLVIGAAGSITTNRRDSSVSYTPRYVSARSLRRTEIISSESPISASTPQSTGLSCRRTGSRPDSATSWSSSDAACVDTPRTCVTNSSTTDSTNVR